MTVAPEKPFGRRSGLCLAAALGLAGHLFSASPQSDADSYAEARRDMAVDQIAARGVHHPAVLRAMGRVPRHRFVPEKLQALAYTDQPLPIGHGQTISQPYIVALMTQLVDPQPGDRVLEIGTGSGYQAAVLSELVKDVFSIEIVPPLADEATERLRRLGYRNVHVRAGDGYKGWPEEAPFDAIIVTCSPADVPEDLVKQLKEGGKLIIPVGVFPDQVLYRMEKKEGRLIRRPVIPVSFVPMIPGSP